ncbi:NAD(P)H-binding protein [Microvirga sp. 3-52]|uniref:NAD-dependent epimerase/dehydratase family protein n=1 Tax=Microvirga sp. 3-52 TaxID=2792425 RepID=UPI001ACAF086|nr:NAD(P)H-binding protein [Microvirga sp. 3-52]MBO1908183.1 NAD(P)H-binding protein [Microvirga sp. 3-52]MBS7454590.1 NAD(P)H-binding protein [Microvirga sp. 3-52]
MRIFLTGATGVIGRRVVHELSTRGHQVTAVGRTAAKYEALRQAGAEPVAVDLFDVEGLRRAVAGHDAVVNLATHMPTSTTTMLFRSAWRENDRIRKVASHILVDAALSGGASVFVQESFAPAYPDSGDRWIDETTPLAPAAYNRTVMDAEAAARRFTDAGGRGVALRFSAFYGPDALQVRDLIRWVRKRWAPLPGKPEAYISSISHDDAAAAVIAVLGVPAGVYNVVDDEPVTHRAYVDALAAALGVPSPRLPPTWLESMMGSVAQALSRSLRISNRKLRQESG